MDPMCTWKGGQTARVRFVSRKAPHMWMRTRRHTCETGYSNA
jgi:hypothetical protein